MKLCAESYIIVAMFVITEVWDHYTVCSHLHDGVLTWKLQGPVKDIWFLLDPPASKFIPHFGSFLTSHLAVLIQCWPSVQPSFFFLFSL